MAPRNYWLDLFTWTTWKEFLEAGGEVSGFRARKRKTVQKIRAGDYLLCYLTGISRFIGFLEVVKQPYKDDRKIWKDEDFPCRVKVKTLLKLEPETAVPIFQLRDQLAIFQNLKSPNAWTGHVRGSPAKWKSSDGEVIVNALIEAQKNPIIRPVDPVKLARRPQALKARIGSVTIPEKSEETNEIEVVSKEIVSHTEIQYILLKLGNDMNLDVWVARNDRGKEVKGNKFSEFSHIKDELPLQFDDATNRTIELIDVLWLKGNAILAAFEIESTTSIYSGLLRMSDLITMQPNINIPLYIVAPDDRRDKVISEVNRPTFSRLNPPMSQMCRFISFSELIRASDQTASLLRHLKPEFLEEFSESCEVEDA